MSKSSAKTPGQQQTDRALLHAERLRKELYATIDLCLISGKPGEVNLQVPRHYVTGPVLREMAFNSDYEGKSLPIVFTDGSRPPAFPAGVLAGGSAPKLETKEKLLARANSVLKVGVMSMRHPELDYLVDFYVTRNAELAKDEDTAADRERLSFNRTLKAFSDPFLDAGAEIWAYHTGFEPMIVGFYRGVTEALLQRRKLKKASLVIRPWLFNKAQATDAIEAEDEQLDDNEEHRALPSYTPESPGANPAFYDPLPPWF